LRAANADEAIAILVSREDIRIVFTDIDMPGSMDGLKLARAVRERWPPIELILISGHFDIRQDEIPERGRFFSKPYRDVCGRLLPKRPGEGCYMPWLSL
jgi:CheY-like chemotaxis protein